MTVVTTNRLSLRHIQFDDASFVVQLLNDPSYIANIGDRHVRTVEDATKYISEKFIQSYQKNGFGLFMVELKGSQTPIGISGLIKRDFWDDVDIGYAFLPSFWGKGYAVESAQGLLDYAKNVVGLKRIVGLSLPHNQSSIRVLEKIGMRFDRMFTMPDNGHVDKLFVLEF